MTRTGEETTVVVGLGSDGHRDRALGPEVVRRLRQRQLGDRVRLVEAEVPADEVLHRWPAEHVVVVSAIAPGYALPGRLHTLVLDTPGRPVDRPGAGSGAGSGADDAGAPSDGAHTLLFAVQRMPRRLAVFTVDAGDVSPGTGLSPAVQRVLDHLVEHVLREVGPRHERTAAPHGGNGAAASQPG